MKKITLIYGGIAGLIVTVMMVFSTYMCYKSTDFKPSEILGYTGMLIAFSFVFMGIKNYRDKHNHGIITFGEAFKIGLFITLIASTFYVVAWLIEYYAFFPDFMEKYAAMVLKQAQESGLAEADLMAKKEQMDMFKEWYKSPIMIILITYMEILPIGLVIALISSFILKRKTAKQ